MLTKRIGVAIAFTMLVGVALAIENYVDYGEELSEKATPSENLRELYRLLVQRNALDNAGFVGVPLEHFMSRKSQRSPSLRLRFGRSGPHASAGTLPRSMGGVTTFDGN